jgi:membrane-associated two-gene conflict system component 1 (EACC1)
MDVLLRVDAGPGADPADHESLAGRLRSELEEHELDPVVPDADAPPGAKGVGAETGSLLIALAASGGVLTTLVGLVQAWLLRNAGSTVVVEIDGDRVELTGASDEERRRALEVWLAKHERRTD